MSPGTGLAIFCFHGVESGEALICTPVAIAQKLGVCFQIENGISQPAALGRREFRKFSHDFSRAHGNYYGDIAWHFQPKAAGWLIVNKEIDDPLLN